MTDAGLRDALEGLLRDRAVKSKGTVPCHQLRELLAAHPAEPVGVSDEAVEAAAEHFQQFILNSPSWEDETKKHLWRECSRAALEAAAPFLQPQVVASLPTVGMIEQAAYNAMLADDALMAPGFSARVEADADDVAEAIAPAVLALMGGAEDETK